MRKITVRVSFHWKASRPATLKGFWLDESIQPPRETIVSPNEGSNLTTRNSFSLSTGQFFKLHESCRELCETGLSITWSGQFVPTSRSWSKAQACAHAYVCVRGGYTYRCTNKHTGTNKCNADAKGSVWNATGEINSTAGPRFQIAHCQLSIIRSRFSSTAIHRTRGRWWLSTIKLQCRYWSYVVGAGQLKINS